MGQVIKLNLNDGGEDIVAEQVYAANDETIRHCGTNRYSQKCCHCGEKVPADQGMLYRDDVNERWLVLHSHDCEPPVQRPSNLPWIVFTAFTLVVILGLLA